MWCTARQCRLGRFVLVILYETLRSSKQHFSSYTSIRFLYHRFFIFSLYHAIRNHSSFSLSVLFTNYERSEKLALSTTREIRLLRSTLPSSAPEDACQTLQGLKMLEGRRRRRQATLSSFCSSLNFSLPPLARRSPSASIAHKTFFLTVSHLSSYSLCVVTRGKGGEMKVVEEDGEAIDLVRRDLDEPDHH